LPNELFAATGHGRTLSQAGRRTKRALLRAPRLSWACAAWSAAALCAIAASVLAVPGWRGALGGGLAVAMIAIAAIDARRYVIPDTLVVVGLALGLVDASIAVPGMVAAAVAAAALRAVVLALFFLVFRMLYRRIRRREGLGLGDVKLAGVAGAWLGWAPAGLAVDIAALLALVAVLIGVLRGQRITGTTRIPFGLFFAPAIWIVWLFEALNWHVLV
jgi:leader peptidase (prepilin peptidase)/N-methyltransferase